MFKKIFLFTILVITSCSFFDLKKERDPNNFYFDDYISTKPVHYKSETENRISYYDYKEAEKKIIEVFPLENNVEEVMDKIRKCNNKMVCKKQNDFKSFNNFYFEYTCEERGGLIIKEHKSIDIYADDKFRLKKIKISYDKGSPLFMYIIAMPFAIMANLITGEY